MITGILLQPLRNGEFIQFMTDVLAIVQKNDPVALKVKTLYDKVKEVTDRLEDLFKISQGSLVTREIETMDLRRDNALNGINAIAAGFAYSTDAAVQKHAQAVAAHLAIFGNVSKDNYQSQTASVRNIVDDWNTKPELQSAITALGLAAWKTELEAANTAFNTAYTARNEELASASADNTKAKRVEANDAYYKLRDRLNSHLDINEGAEPWAKTVSLINQTISNYNDLLARRAPSTPTTEQETQPTA